MCLCREPQKPAPAPKVNGSGRLPDPELFPYLARRLAAVEGTDPLDDVHAAAAMLQLKHGSRLTLGSGESSVYSHSLHMYCPG